MHDITIKQENGFNYSDHFSEEDANAIEFAVPKEEITLSGNRIGTLNDDGTFTVVSRKGNNLMYSRIVTVKYSELCKALNNH